MSWQSYAVTLIYTTLFVLVLIKTNWNVPILVSAGVAMIFVLMFSYDTDCLTNGGCSSWSGIRTIVVTIAPLLAIIFILTGQLEIKEVTKQVDTYVLAPFRNKLSNA